MKLWKQHEILTNLAIDRPLNIMVVQREIIVRKLFTYSFSWTWVTPVLKHYYYIEVYTRKQCF